MKKLIVYIIFNIILANQITIDLITTNDIHGVVNKQTAYFMNPEYPLQLLEAQVFINI